MKFIAEAILMVLMSYYGYLIWSEEPFTFKCMIGGFGFGTLLVTRDMLMAFMK